MASEKVSEEKKSTPSTNIPLLLYENQNKTARIRAKARMFRLPFKVYGAVITFEKLNVKKN